MKGEQLGKIWELILTSEQLEKVLACTRTARSGGGYQRCFRRIYDSVEVKGGRLVAFVNEGDMERIRRWARRVDPGTRQDLCREILEGNRRANDPA